MKDAIEARLKIKLNGNHWAVPWMVKHAAANANRLRVNKNGKTAFEEIRGRKFKGECIVFGEGVHALKAETVGKDKFNTRWTEGIYVGHREESNEIIIGTK